MPINPNPINLREAKKQQEQVKKFWNLTKEEKAERAKASTAMKQAFALYRQEKDRVSDAALQQQIRALFQGQKAFSHLEWVSDDQLQFLDRGVTVRVEFSKDAPTEPPSKADIETRQSENRKREVSKIDAWLRRNRCLFFVSTEGGIIFPGGDPRARVNLIMKNASLTNEQRTSLLAGSDLLRSYSAALDVIANYNPQEWRIPVVSK